MSAKIQVPFFGVPMTMQMLVVLTLAAISGPKLALLSMGAYLAASFAFPVTAHPAGLLGPTGVYLVGFLVATAIVSFAASSEARGPIAFMTRLALMTLGATIIYALGLVWLYQFTWFYPDPDGLARLTFERTFEIGLLPFWVKDFVSIIVAALIAQGMWQIIPRR